MITGPWKAEKDGTVTTVAGTHKGKRVVATCERAEDAKAIEQVPELVRLLQAVRDGYSPGEDCECEDCTHDTGIPASTLDEIEAVLARAEGLRG